MEFRDRVDAHRAVILLAPMEGEMRFIALTARLDVRYDARNGGPVSPGKATMRASNGIALGTAGRLVGHVYIHGGDDSGFLCELIGQSSGCFSSVFGVCEK